MKRRTTGIIVGIVIAILIVGLIIVYMFTTFVDKREEPTTVAPVTTTTEVTTAEPTTTMVPTTVAPATTTTEVTTAEPTTVTMVTETTTTEATTAMASQDTDTGIKLYLYYQAGQFVMDDITPYTASSIEGAKAITPTGVKTEVDDDVIYIEPEVRLYGVSKEADVSVVVESEATKADKLKVSYNDGVYQFFYWSTEMYDSLVEGEYRFKVTIEQENEETVIFYKVIVSEN